MGRLDMMRFVSFLNMTYCWSYMSSDVECLPSRVLYRGNTERFKPRWRWIAGLSTSWRPDVPRRPVRTTSIKGRDHAVLNHGLGKRPGWTANTHLTVYWQRS
jgi:hypothetical protein